MVGGTEVLKGSGSETWSGMGEVMERNGIETRSDEKVVPYNTAALYRNGDHYKYSRTTVRNIQEELCCTEIFIDTWKDLLVTKKERRDVCFTISKEKFKNLKTTPVIVRYF